MLCHSRDTTDSAFFFNCLCLTLPSVLNLPLARLSTTHFLVVFSLLVLGVGVLVLVLGGDDVPGVLVCWYTGVLMLVC